MYETEFQLVTNTYIMCIPYRNRCPSYKFNYWFILIYSLTLSQDCQSSHKGKQRKKEEMIIEGDSKGKGMEWKGRDNKWKESRRKEKNVEEGNIFALCFLRRNICDWENQLKQQWLKVTQWREEIGISVLASLPQHESRDRAKEPFKIHECTSLQHNFMITYS